MSGGWDLGERWGEDSRGSKKEKMGIPTNKYA